MHWLKAVVGKFLWANYSNGPNNRSGSLLSLCFCRNMTHLAVNQSRKQISIMVVHLISYRTCFSKKYLFTKRRHFKLCFDRRMHALVWPQAETNTCFLVPVVGGSKPSLLWSTWQSGGSQEASSRSSINDIVSLC